MFDIDPLEKMHGWFMHPVLIIHPWSSPILSLWAIESHAHVGVRPNNQSQRGPRTRAPGLLDASGGRHKRVIGRPGVQHVPGSVSPSRGDDDADAGWA